MEADCRDARSFGQANPRRAPGRHHASECGAEYPHVQWKPFRAVFGDYRARPCTGLSVKVLCPAPYRWRLRRYARYEGFRIVRSEFDPRHFGDSVVTLQSDALRLRFVRDRGQVILDVGPTSEPDTWWGFLAIYEATHALHRTRHSNTASGSGRGGVRGDIPARSRRSK